MSRVFSRSTTSSPRRKISTSSLSKRNSLGKRTAWLLPDRNTRAVDIVHPLNVYTSKYIQLVSLSRLGGHKDRAPHALTPIGERNASLQDSGTGGFAEKARLRTVSLIGWPRAVLRGRLVCDFGGQPDFRI